MTETNAGEATETMPTQKGMDFRPVGWEDYDRIYPYTSVYGEGSCQHSPVSMASQQEKYGDAVCEEDGFLYTLRENLCDDTWRVYLAPLGGGDMEEAFRRILADAAARGKKARFETLTEKTAELLKASFPDRFDFQEQRDMAEYFCTTESTATFAGGALQRRRREVNTFWNTYGARADVARLEPDIFPEVLEFEEKWLRESEETHDMHALRTEARMIAKQLEHFEHFHLSGIVLRIDGAVEGFSYGTKLSDRVYDALVEKVNREIPNIARVLRQESTKHCAMDCEYVNMEEDVGVPGLRALKTAYKPAYLLNKYTAAER